MCFESKHIFELNIFVICVHSTIVYFAWLMLSGCCSGAPAVGSDVVSVSVIKGDSVIFHTGVETSQQEDIKWYFNDNRIAQISGDLSHICTDVQCEDGDERFRDRLKLDHQTGSLNITNTRTTDSGLYELKIIRSTSSSDKIFNVTVNGESFNKCLNAV